MVACAYAEDANTPKILQYVNAIEDLGMRVQCLMQAIDIVAAVDNTIALNLTEQGLEDVRRLKDRPITGKPMKVDQKPPIIATSACIVNFSLRPAKMKQRINIRQRPIKMEVIGTQN